MDGKVYPQHFSISWMSIPRKTEVVQIQSKLSSQEKRNFFSIFTFILFVQAEKSLTQLKETMRCECDADAKFGEKFFTEN